MGRYNFNQKTQDGYEISPEQAKKWLEKNDNSCEENLEMPAHGSGCCHRLSFASAAQQTSENGQNRSDYLEVVLNG